MAKNKNHNLIKRRDTWYLKKRVNGRWIRKALSTSVTEARRQRDELIREIDLYGDIQHREPEDNGHRLFGEVSQEWIAIKATEIRSSTLREYRCSMNYHILPKIGNTPIKDLGYLEIKRLIANLTCSGKRLKNVMVPMREVFKFAQLAGFIDKNPMALVANPKVAKPDIHPLSMEEVNRFLEVVSPRYRNFFIVAFFTGMRFGEMAALKWRNVDFRMGIIKVRETRVEGEEGPPKTKRSVRDIDMLPPVVDACCFPQYSLGRRVEIFTNA